VLTLYQAGRHLGVSRRRLRAILGAAGIQLPRDARDVPQVDAQALAVAQAVLAQDPNAERAAVAPARRRGTKAAEDPISPLDGGPACRVCGVGERRPALDGTYEQCRACGRGVEDFPQPTTTTPAAAFGLPMPWTIPGRTLPATPQPLPLALTGDAAPWWSHLAPPTAPMKHCPVCKGTPSMPECPCEGRGELPATLASMPYATLAALMVDVEGARRARRRNRLR